MSTLFCYNLYINEVFMNLEEIKGIGPKTIELLNKLNIKKGEKAKSDLSNRA